MPANLPPQYHITEAKLKEAKAPEEKISIYEELLSIAPKHKGTENLQKDLKTKIAKLRKILGSKKKTKKELLYIVKKEGGAQVVITGPPNSGKSSLLNALTNAKAKTSEYPFTTKIPQPAMMPYEDILIQLIDTPPLTNDFSPGWLKSILKNADILIIVFDLSKKNEVDDFFKLLKNLKIDHKKTLLIGNKIDLEKSKQNIKKMGTFPQESVVVSCLEKTGLEELKQKIFELAEIVRVYTKSPNRETDFAHPFTLAKGSKLLDLAQEIHYDLAEKFKYARLFRKDLRKPIIVGKEYVLQDKDVIEIHA